MSKVHHPAAPPVVKYNHHITIVSTGLDKRDYASPKVYEDNVKRVLDSLGRSKTGKAVLHQMDIGKKNLTIMPYNADDKKSDKYNAYAFGTDADHATVKGGHWTDTKGKVHDGLGGGSDSVIHFSSSTWFSYVHTHKGHTSGAHPDEILLHEMVHSLRQMIGKSEQKSLDHMFDTEEEFFAVVVADIYASELKRTADIRSDHHGFDRIADNLDTSAEFLPKVDPADYKYRLVQKMVKQEPHLCHALAQVPAAFNPIRRYFDLAHRNAKPHAHPPGKPATPSHPVPHRHNLRHGMPVRHAHH